MQQGTEDGGQREAGWQGGRPHGTHVPRIWCAARRRSSAAPAGACVAGQLKLRMLVAQGFSHWRWELTLVDLCCWLVSATGSWAAAGRYGLPMNPGAYDGFQAERAEVSTRERPGWGGKKNLLTVCVPAPPACFPCLALTLKASGMRTLPGSLFHPPTLCTCLAADGGVQRTRLQCGGAGWRQPQRLGPRAAGCSRQEVRVGWGEASGMVPNCAAVAHPSGEPCLFFPLH